MSTYSLQRFKSTIKSRGNNVRQIFPITVQGHIISQWKWKPHRTPWTFGEHRKGRPTVSPSHILFTAQINTTPSSFSLAVTHNVTHQHLASVVWMSDANSFLNNVPGPGWTMTSSVILVHPEDQVAGWTRITQKWENNPLPCEPRASRGEIDWMDALETHSWTLRASENTPPLLCECRPSRGLSGWMLGIVWWLTRSTARLLWSEGST